MVQRILKTGHDDHTIHTPYSTLIIKLIESVE